MNFLRHCLLITGSITALIPGTMAGADAAALSPDEAAARVRAGVAVLIDVRESTEWEETGVVAGARLLALSDLRGARAQWKPFLEAHRDKELILYCRSGTRAGQAARILAAEGWHVANAGGFRAWVEAGQPTRAVQEPATPAAADAAQ